MKTIRRYHLGSEETRGSDTSFSLIFTDAGRMYVRVMLQYEQAYKTGEVTEINPPDFSSVTVGGALLSDLVARKLDEILPATPLKWPDA